MIRKISLDWFKEVDFDNTLQYVESMKNYLVELWVKEEFIHFKGY